MPAIEVRFKLEKETKGASLQPPETVGGDPTDGAHRQSALYHNLTEPAPSTRSALELPPGDALQ
jgi:hypothetical protein